MKNVFLVGGTMGVGKTAACQTLKRKLQNSVFLDGDWCWDMNPFAVTDETKTMVIENICFLLNNFIRCSQYETVIFGWVMHRQDILDDILSRLDSSGCRVLPISLICREDILAGRLQKDIESGVRPDDGIIERATARLPAYRGLNTRKIDVSSLTPDETAMRMIEMLGKRGA